MNEQVRSFLIRGAERLVVRGVTHDVGLGPRWFVCRGVTHDMGVSSEVVRMSRCNHDVGVCVLGGTYVAVSYMMLGLSPRWYVCRGEIPSGTYVAV